MARKPRTFTSEANAIAAVKKSPFHAFRHSIGTFDDGEGARLFKVTFKVTSQETADRMRADGWQVELIKPIHLGKGRLTLPGFGEVLTGPVDVYLIKD